MKIYAHDFEETLRFLAKQRNDGNEFIAFLEDDIAIYSETFVCMPTEYDVREYCYENSTDHDRYDFLATRSAYRAMSEALQNQSYMIEKNGLVDIAAMVGAYHRRLEEEQTITNNKNSKNMNNENYEDLKDQLKLTGFGSEMSEELKAKMETLQPEFQLQHQAKIGEREMDYTLNFRKSDTQDNYFFNSYKATLKRENAPEVSNTFYVDQRITAKEAFNLLEGRSVQKKYNHHELVNENGKEFHKAIKNSTYDVWVKLNLTDADKHGNYPLKKYGEKHGFDLEKKLSELPIRQLNNVEDKKDLLSTLKKGNVASVTFEQDGKTESRFVEANPRAWSINVYDSNMSLIEDIKMAKNIAPDAAEKENKQAEKVAEGVSDEDGPTQKNERGRSKGIK